MIGKTLQELKEKTQFIENAALFNMDDAAEALRGKYPSPVPASPQAKALTPLAAEAGDSPDWKKLMRFIARELELARVHLQTVASAHALEQEDDRRKMAERDAVIQDAYSRLVHVRHVLEHAVGETAAFELLSIEGETPRRPQTLLTTMELAGTRLRDPERLPVDLRIPGMTLSWEDLAAGLDREAEKLRAVLDQQQQEDRQAGRALHHKNDMQSIVNDTYVGFSKVLEGLYIASGERWLVDRLRWNASTPRGRNDNEENSPETLPIRAAPSDDGPGFFDRDDLEEAGALPIVALAPGRADAAEDES